MTLMITVVLVFLLVLQVADAWTTYQILSRGGRELNGVMRFFLNKFGVLGGVLVTKIPLGFGLIWVTYHGLISDFLLGILCVIYLGVVIHNLYQLFRN